MHETGKAVARRLRDARFATRYFRGAVLDIGSGDDSVGNYADHYPLIRTVRDWDKADGDAQTLEGLSADTFDTILSSHCLEHLVDPVAALVRWIYVCKPGGHLVIVVPDQDLYEQGFWPSRFNLDHKHGFSIAPPQPRSAHTISVLDMLALFSHRVAVLKVELLDAGYIYGLPPHDQSLSMACEPAIEIILRKKPHD